MTRDLYNMKKERGGGEEEKNKIATGFYPHSDEPRVKDTARLTSKAFYSAMVCVCLCVCAKRETVHIDRLCGSTPINPLPPPPLHERRNVEPTSPFRLHEGDNDELIVFFCETFMWKAEPF